MSRFEKYERTLLQNTCKTPVFLYVMRNCLNISLSYLLINIHISPRNWRLMQFLQRNPGTGVSAGFPYFERFRLSLKPHLIIYTLQETFGERRPYKHNRKSYYNIQ